MKKHITVTAVFFAVLFVLSCVPAVPFAEANVSQSEIDALREKTKQIERNKQDLQKKLDGMKAEKAGAIAQKAVYDQQIATLDEEIEVTAALLDGLSEEIAAKTVTLEATIEREEESRVLYESRIAAMQRMGTISYLSLLLDAENFSDFLARWDAMRRIMDYDSSLIEAFRSARADLEAERAALEADRRELAASREGLAAAQSDLSELSVTADNLILGMVRREEDMQGDVDELTAAELAAERELERLEAQLQRQIQAELRRLEAERRAAAEAERRRKEAEERARQEEEERKRLEEEAQREQETDEDGNPIATPQPPAQPSPPEQPSNDGGSPYIGGGYIWPIPGHTRVSSEFGPRNHPVFGGRRHHSGIDVPAPRGTNVVASGHGTILMRTFNGGYGNCVVIYHGGGHVTLYAHLHSFGKFQVGDSVRQGDVIGHVGSTGVSTGNHLHFEIIINGTPVNPRGHL